MQKQSLLLYRQESRLTSVDLNLKNCVKHVLMFISSFKHEKTIDPRASSTGVIQWSVIKEPQNSRPFYCLSLFKNDIFLFNKKLKAESPETLFHTRSNLLCLICWSVSSLLCDLLFTVYILQFQLFPSVFWVYISQFLYSLQISEFKYCNSDFSPQFSEFISHNSYLSSRVLSLYLVILTFSLSFLSLYLTIPI